MLLCTKVLKILCTAHDDYHCFYILYKREKFLTFIRQNDSKYFRNAENVHVDWKNVLIKKGIKCLRYLNFDVSSLRHPKHNVH